MAFQSKNLTVIAYANGNTIWHYKTQDSIESIMNDSKYFGDIWALAACGDIFFITSGGRTYQRQIVKIGEETITLGKLD